MGTIEWEISTVESRRNRSEDIPLVRIRVSPARIYLYPRESHELNVTLEPENANIGTVEWILTDYDEDALKIRTGSDSERIVIINRTRVQSRGPIGEAWVGALVSAPRGGTTLHNKMSRVNVVNPPTEVPDSITEDSFGGWYNTATGLKGVNHRVPRFVQLKAGPCLGYCIMMGDHYMNFKDDEPNEFFSSRRHLYLDENDDAKWLNITSENKSYNHFNEIRNKLVSELNEGRPVVVSGNNGKTDHFALVVAYAGHGVTQDDFIVIDPWYTVTFSGKHTYRDFHRDYPHDTTRLRVPNRIYTFIKI
jgi:hypothetical protein